MRMELVNPLDNFWSGLFNIKEPVPMVLIFMNEDGFPVAPPEKATMRTYTSGGKGSLCFNVEVTTPKGFLDIVTRLPGGRYLKAFTKEGRLVGVWDNIGVIPKGKTLHVDFRLKK